MNQAMTNKLLRALEAAGGRARWARGCALAAAVAVVCSAPAAAGIAAHAHRSAQAAAPRNPSVYLDSTGDSGVAPDVFLTTVSNTYSGVVTFRVMFANRSPLNPDDVLSIILDTDQNPATGDESGMDYILQVHGASAVLARLLGGGRYEIVSAASVQAAWSDGEVVSVASSDLGDTTAFDFFLLGFVDSDTSVRDDSPDGTGVWSYKLGAPAISSVRATFSPQQPKAGARFRVKVASVLLASDESVVPDALTCRASVAGKALRVTAADGVCSLKVPKTAKRKLLRLVVKVRVRDQVKTLTYLRRVR